MFGKARTYIYIYIYLYGQHKNMHNCGANVARKVLMNIPLIKWERKYLNYSFRRMRRWTHLLIRIQTYIHTCIHT